MSQLRQAIAELPERQADVFWLSEVENLEHKEIADRMGATSQQLAMWLHRFKQKCVYYSRKEASQTRSGNENTD